MRRAKLAILASTALCMGIGSSQAATPDPWVGLYVGGNLGYSWGNTNTTTTVGSFTQTALFTFVFPGGASSTSLKPDGVIGGGQIGYVWRVAPRWLAGIETDLQWSGEKNSGRSGFGGATTNCTSGNCSYTSLADITARLSWFGTLRGRLGYEWNGLWVYGTGGLAYGNVSISGANTLLLINNNGGAIVGVYSTPFSYSSTRVGVAVGAGIEGLLGRYWRWKLEYLHIDLGSIGGGTFGGVPLVTVNTGRFTDEILRFGFNYRFTYGP